MLDPAREVICCEGYGPGGVAVVVTCAAAGRAPSTDEVRAAFREHGGRLGATGSVAYLFRTVGLLRYANEPGLRVHAAAAGAEEIIVADAGNLDLYTDPGERAAIEQGLKTRGYVCRGRGSGWRAMQGLQLPYAERQRLDELTRRLTALEGVGHVYSNAQTTDQLLATI
jgi:transcriptional/translational regulatory protein YebC/TACO1